MVDVLVPGAIGCLASRSYSRGRSRLAGEIDGAVLLYPASPQDEDGMRVEIVVRANSDATRCSLRRIEDSDLGHLTAGVLLLPLHHAEGGSGVAAPRR